MAQSEKEPWPIAAARYCVENTEKCFSELDLKEYLKSKYDLAPYQVQQFFEEEIKQPTGRPHSRRCISDDANGQAIYTAPLELVQKITDYDELKFARETAEKASRHSTLAIAIALVTLIVSVGITIFYTQTVHVENMPRFLQTSYLVAQ